MERYPARRLSCLILAIFALLACNLGKASATVREGHTEDPLCSAEQNLALANLQANARGFTSQAGIYLATLPGSALPFDQPYHRWFGDFTNQRFFSVLDTLALAERLLDVTPPNPPALEYRCPTAYKRCTYLTSYDTEAFVESDDPTMTIHICPLFWTEARTGFLSSWGALVHEAIHLVDPRASDQAYSFQSCLSLASSSPDLAVHNPNNFRYFVESMPP